MPQLMWFVLPIALVAIFSIVGAAISVKVSNIRKLRHDEKWKLERLKNAPLCRDEKCESVEHCGQHHCHCDRNMTVNCHCVECGCAYWVPGM